ncbi:equilibrative nucleoside transporter 3-like isoform X2 [Stegodyphus dumicola]|uniref:equilibrative nucleoside transporter 3-like isoform X2 n=1 Tax=Stegodyphus dumicola TaxID=202533 RepID=UPI0015B24036|nr:equilibrative nucleoside transporter 3-like isoform X2 [Stegodyphus dumicola]
MEQETLLDPGPVRLAPCWESRHAPTDELNFKTSTPKADIDGMPPKDRLNLVFLILMLHGIGTLMPWNMFITASSYFVDFKLNINDTDGSTEEYRQHFLSYLGVASQVPNVICNALNIFVQFGGGNLTFRIIGSVLVEIIIFIITVILAMLDSSTWPGAFFYMTMASVVVINMANGIYQNSLYGLAAKLPMKYSMAIILGANTSGTFTSLISILSIAASPNQRTAAIYYFITALFVLLACVDTYFALPLIRFYRYHDRLEQKAITDSRTSSSQPPYCKILCKIWPQCFNVFFVFFVTLTIFPAIHAEIKPIDPNFIIPDVYFTPITTYLCFNFFAMVGSMVPNWIKWPGPKFLCVPVILRVLFIPFFMLCNYIPSRRRIPVFITNDWAYFGGAVALGFTSGYYSSLAMMYAPRCVETEHASIAGMIAALFLVLGIVCGVNFTFFVSWLVESKIF